MENNTFFLDTMQGLLEAIAIDSGAIKMESVSGMPTETLRAVDFEKNLKKKKGITRS
jgi:hypothetical protein